MISIITPTYNRAHLISRMIENVIKQSFQNWELIIMDDGSSDNTKEVVESYGDTRIKYYSSGNSGAADKRNKGVEVANYNYIIFLDSDDAPKPHWLELLLNKVHGKKNAIASCGWEKINDQKELIQFSPPQNLGPLFNNITLNYLAGSLLIKKEFFLETGGFDISLPAGHHTDLLLRLIPVFEKNNVKIENISEPLLTIHSHSGNKIRSNNSSVYHGTMSLLKKHHLKFKNNRKDHINYLGVAAVSALKMGEIKEGKKLLRKAFIIMPYRKKSLFRVIAVQFPFLRNIIWK